MTCNVTADRTKPALALSGGGFRATLFHLGSIIRLNELGYLQRFERISSVSGGSITAGMLATRWHRLQFVGGVAQNLVDEVEKPLRLFCKRNVDAAAVTRGAITPGKSIGDVLADIYDDDLFEGATLQDLPDSPQFLFNATNYQTGRLVRMQKVRFADYLLGAIPDPDLRVATVVAASSAFPPILSPVVVTFDPDRWIRCEGADMWENIEFKRTLNLMDGGAYDNLGLETIDDFHTIIVSDAGAPFSMEKLKSPVWSSEALRALDVATDQARSLRKRILFNAPHANNKVRAYAGIDSDLDQYPAPRRLRVSENKTKRLKGIRTRLNRFSDKDQGELINWGWYMTDVAMRSFVTRKATAPRDWPMKHWPLG